MFSPYTCFPFNTVSFIPGRGWDSQPQDLICSSRLKWNTMPWDQVPSSAGAGQEEMFLMLAQLVAALGEFVFIPNSWLTSLLGGKESQGREGFTFATVLSNDVLLFFNDCVQYLPLRNTSECFASGALLCTAFGFGRLGYVCFLLSLIHQTSGAELELRNCCLALISRTSTLMARVTGLG